MTWKTKLADLASSNDYVTETSVESFTPTTLSNAAPKRKLHQKEIDSMVGRLYGQKYNINEVDKVKKQIGRFSSEFKACDKT